MSKKQKRIEARGGDISGKTNTLPIKIAGAVAIVILIALWTGLIEWDIIFDTIISYFREILIFSAYL